MVFVVPAFLAIAAICICKQLLYFQVGTKYLNKRLKISYKKTKISEDSVYNYKTIDGNECFKIIRFPLFYQIEISEGFQFQNREFSDATQLKFKRNMTIRIVNKVDDKITSVTRISKSDYK